MSSRCSVQNHWHFEHYLQSLCLPVLHAVMGSRMTRRHLHVTQRHLNLCEHTQNTPKWPTHSTAHSALGRVCFMKVCALGSDNTFRCLTPVFLVFSISFMTSVPPSCFSQQHSARSSGWEKQFISVIYNTKVSEFSIVESVGNRVKLKWKQFHDISIL
jgi:hypothetical protein